MFKRLGESLRRFLYGRYGSDQLNLALLIAAVVLSLLSGILSLLLPVTAGVYTNLLLSTLMYALLVIALFRMLSRNIAKRQRENQKFRNFWTRLTDRKNRYFRCPQCSQTVRVPRHRGKINIRCPKCCERFIRKT